MIDSEDIKYLGMGIRNLLRAGSSREKFISGLDNLLALGFMEHTERINIISAPARARTSWDAEVAYAGKLQKKDGSWAFQELTFFCRSYQSHRWSSTALQPIAGKPYKLIEAVVRNFAPPGTYLPGLLEGCSRKAVRDAFARHGLVDRRLTLNSPLVEVSHKQYNLLKKLWDEECE